MGHAYDEYLVLGLKTGYDKGSGAPSELVVDGLDSS
jgi:hypothetical protein